MTILQALLEDTAKIIKSLSRSTAVSLFNEKLCQSVVNSYHKLNYQEKLRFVSALVFDYGLSPPKSTEKFGKGSSHVIAVELPAEIGQSGGSGNHEVEELQLEALKRANSARAALTPGYYNFFLSIGRLSGGVHWLVQLRADLLKLQQEPIADLSLVQIQALNILSYDLRQLLEVWFSPGLVHLQRLTWNSSASLLDKVATYEAVHPLRSWLDLRRRVGPYRRCFVFTHPCMPNEPLVIAHAALTPKMMGNMAEVLRTDQPTTMERDQFGGPHDPREFQEDLSQVRAAILYSITSPHSGLKGIELGNTLIKKVTRQLLAEFPHMTTFCSLSPIPGFTRWLFGELNRHLQREVLARIVQDSSSDNEEPLLTAQESAQLSAALGTGGSTKDLLAQLRLKLECIGPELSPFPSAAPGASTREVDAVVQSGMSVMDNWTTDTDLVEALKTPLMTLCAKYLYAQKKRGFAYDPVANFHLRNGAVMYRLNWLADRSARGLRQSCGIMVNYRYYPERTTELAERYAKRKRIELGRDMAKLLFRNKL